MKERHKTFYDEVEQMIIKELEMKTVQAPIPVQSGAPDGDPPKSELMNRMQNAL